MNIADLLVIIVDVALVDDDLIYLHKFFVCAHRLSCAVQIPEQLRHKIFIDKSFALSDSYILGVHSIKF